MSAKPGVPLAAVLTVGRQARSVFRARRSDLDQTIADAEAALVRAREEAAATSGPERALEDWRRLAADAAPGLASAPWGHWVVEPEPSEAGPCLYRVGSVAGEIPALVHLLDAGHLRITGKDMAAADAVVDSLLVRIVATTRPGSVRISLYDPRRLGAGLGGFHALSRPGLLTVYGVEELKDLLGGLD